MRQSVKGIFLTEDAILSVCSGILLSKSSVRFAAAELHIPSVAIYGDSSGLRLDHYSDRERNIHY